MQFSALVWNPTNHTIEGWDFSLPDGLAPAPNSLLGISRKINFNGFFDKYKLNFRANVTAVIWARWRDLEPKEGEYQIERLLSYIKEAKQDGPSAKNKVPFHRSFLLDNIIPTIGTSLCDTQRCHA